MSFGYRGKIFSLQDFGIVSNHVYSCNTSSINDLVIIKEAVKMNHAWFFCHGAVLVSLVAFYITGRLSCWPADYPTGSSIINYSSILPSQVMD